MDRFSEQLVQRSPDKKTNLLKALIIIGTIAVIGLLGWLLVYSGFTLAMLCAAAAIGAVWLSIWLMKRA